MLHHMKFFSSISAATTDDTILSPTVSVVKDNEETAILTLSTIDGEPLQISGTSLDNLVVIPLEEPQPNNVLTWFQLSIPRQSDPNFDEYLDLIGTGWTKTITGHRVDVEFNDDIVSIPSKLFLDKLDVVRIILPSTVKRIEDYSICVCYELRIVNIPNGIEYIGKRNFTACKKLLGLKVDESCQNYSTDEDGILYDKNKTKLLAYPGGIEHSVVTVRDGVTTIGISAFQDQTSLTKIILPSSVINVESNAFAGCTGLESDEDGFVYVSTYLIEVRDETRNNYVIKDGTEYICEHALYYPYDKTSFTITLPNTIKEIRDFALYDAHHLTSLSVNGETIVPETATFPDSLEVIGNSCFWGNYGIKKYDFSNTNLTTLKSNVFYESYANEVILSTHMTSIDNNAFASANSLTTIKCPTVTPPTYNGLLLPRMVTTIKVPTGTKQAYAAAWGIDESKFVEED